MPIQSLLFNSLSQLNAHKGNEAVMTLQCLPPRAPHSVLTSPNPVVAVANSSFDTEACIMSKVKVHKGPIPSAAVVVDNSCKTRGVDCERPVMHKHPRAITAMEHIVRVRW